MTTLRDDAEGVASSVSRLAAKSGDCVNAERDLVGSLMDLVDHHVDRARLPRGDAPPDTTLENDDERSLWVLGAVDMDEDQADRLVRSYRRRLPGGDAPQDHGPADVVRAMVREHGRKAVEAWARGVHPWVGDDLEPSCWDMERGLAQALGYHGPTLWPAMLAHVKRNCEELEASRPPGGAEPGLSKTRRHDADAGGYVIDRMDISVKVGGVECGRPVQGGTVEVVPEPSQTPDAPGWSEARVAHTILCWFRPHADMAADATEVDLRQIVLLIGKLGGRCTRGAGDPVTEADLAKVAAELVHQWNLDGREHAGDTTRARELVLRDLSPLLGCTRGARAPTGDAARGAELAAASGIKLVNAVSTQDYRDVLARIQELEGAKDPPKRPTCLTEVEAWSPSSDRTMLTLQLDNSDRRQLLAWGGAQAPDDGLRERVAALGERLERAELRAARKAEDCTGSAVDYARYRCRGNTMADASKWLRAALGGGS